jgi:hypothetical protein
MSALAKPAAIGPRSLPRLPHSAFWAKTTADNRPGLSVRDHCLNVGAVAEALRRLLPETLRGLLSRRQLREALDPAAA